MSNRTAPVGAVVSLYVDLDRRVAVGDIIETRTGRGYHVLSVRVQEGGKNAGRQHLKCTVLGREWVDEPLVSLLASSGSHVHRIRWYRRKRGAGVVSR